VRNVIYQFDHGRAYPHPNKIHGDQDALARVSDLSLTCEDIAKEEHAFFIMRHPTRRFLSLYFDKIIGQGTGRFDHIKRLLANANTFDVNANSVHGHLENCYILAGILKQGMQDADYLPPNPHWAMQTARIPIIKKCRLKVLLLENFDAQLIALLRDIIPDVAEVLNRMRGRNESPKPIEPQALMTPELVKRIAEIYPRDQRIYDRAATLWKGIDISNANVLDVPRLFP
jgi:hypothetical protein